MSDRIRPFSNGSEYHDWRGSNCERCAKGHNEVPTCPMQHAIDVEAFITGDMPSELATRCGRGEPTSFRCPEWEASDEWKAEHAWRKSNPPRVVKPTLADYCRAIVEAFEKAREMAPEKYDPDDPQCEPFGWRCAWSVWWSLCRPRVRTVYPRWPGAKGEGGA